MSRVYSKRIVFMHDGGTAIYVVPAGFTLVIRCVTFFNADALLAKSGELIDVTSDCTIVQRSVAPEASEINDMRVVLDEGQELQVTAEAEMDVTVSGYLLSLP